MQQQETLTEHKTRGSLAQSCEAFRALSSSHALTLALGVNEPDKTLSIRDNVGGHCGRMLLQPTASRSAYLVELRTLLGDACVLRIIAFSVLVRLRSGDVERPPRTRTVVLHRGALAEIAAAAALGVLLLYVLI